MEQPIATAKRVDSSSSQLGLLFEDEQSDYGSSLSSDASLSSLAQHTAPLPTRSRPQEEHRATASTASTCPVYRAAKEVGSIAFGVIGIDVWLLQHGRFVHERLWVDDIFRLRHPSLALSKLVCEDRRDYCMPVPQVPGAGLAGYFWSLNTNGSTTLSASGENPLLWRNLRAITSDPFQPPYRRMTVLQDAGFGKATGIPFDVFGHRGVVVFLTRASADEEALNKSADYLRAGAVHIGSVSAIRVPRQAVLQQKQRRMKQLCKRLRTKGASLSVFSTLRRTVSMRSLRGSLDNTPIFLSERSSSHKVSFQTDARVPWLRGITQQTLLYFLRFLQTVRTRLKARFMSLVEKSTKATDLEPPPPAPLENAIWTFSGVFLTLLSLFVISERFQARTGEGIVLAPFGALLTLQFSLTAAPASQPRNALYGQLLSLSLAVLGRHHLAGVLPNRLLVPLIAALAIATMTKLGIPHPPAAAAVIALFAQPNGFNVLTALLVFVGNLVAVCLAILINNLSDKRQYPVYWKFGIDLGSIKKSATQIPLSIPALSSLVPFKQSRQETLSNSVSFSLLSTTTDSFDDEGPIRI